MEKHIISYGDLNLLPGIANKLLQVVPAESRVFAFYGPMGAGKTTLIKEICRLLGSHDSFSSPTYSVVNEYLIDAQNRIYHIDLYRLNKIEEALTVGIDEYLNSGSYVFIEWPELIEPLLPPQTVKIEMEVENNIRELSIFIG